MADQDIAELRQQFSDDTAEWQDIRKERGIDMRYVSGDPWDEKERRAREEAGRPCFTCDELGQYVNQVINEVRANKRAVKFAPVGNGANDKSAEFYADKMREIEYRSRAQIAYTTAFENAVQGGYGFCRVNTRYESPTSIAQDIWIDPVHNPDLITPDPYALMPDLSDMQHCWVREPWRIEDFNRRWPDFEVEKGSREHTGLMVDVTQWVNDRLIWVAELWKVERKARTLLIVEPRPPMAQPGMPMAPPQSVEPRGVWKEDYRPEMGTVKRERESESVKVYQCLTNGVEIIEEKRDWPGKYIPIIGCLGKVLYVDGKREMHSAIRLAREPFLAYCFYRTCEIENVGMTTKNPYWAYEGQLDQTQVNEIAKSVHEPVAVLFAKPTVEGAPPGTVLPLPQRNVSEPAIQALSVGAEEMRRAIQAAMGQSPLPTSAQRRNEKSGIALKHIEEAGQRGSFHFTDHYLDMVQHVGVICEDLIDKVYDTARQVGVRKPNDDAETVWINNPQEPDSYDTKGDHLVTVSTGPSFESEREAASDFADTLAGMDPQIFQILGPLVVKLKNLGPIGDEMAELLEAVQPPPIQALRDKKKQGQNDPAAAQQELAQLKQQLQQVMQAAQQMQQALETEQAKQKSTIEKAKIDAQTTLAVAKMREATAMAVAKLQALVKPEQAAKAEAIENDLDRQHDAIMAEVEHEHALEMEQAKAQTAAMQLERQRDMAGEEQGREHAHQAGMAGMQHDHALEQGERGVEGQLKIVKAKPQPMKPMK